VKIKHAEKCVYLPLDISGEDVYGAMKEISGYLDITPGNFKELYRLAYRHAVERLIRSTRAPEPRM